MEGVVVEWNFNFDVVLLIKILPTNAEVVSSLDNIDAECQKPVAVYLQHG